MSSEPIRSDVQAVLRTLNNGHVIPLRAIVFALNPSFEEAVTEGGKNGLFQSWRSGLLPGKF